MIGAHLTQRQWWNLPKADRIELIAYFELKHRQRLSLLHEAIEKIPGEFGMLAQVIIEAID